MAFRLFMFLVPYAFVMVTGFGLSATAAGQVPKDAAHSAGIGGLLASAVASTSTMSLANRLFALVFGGIALAFTARSLVTVLWIVHRLIWGVTPSGHPTPWAPLILIGYVTVLFGVIDLAAWLGSQSLGLRLVAILLTDRHVGCRLAAGIVVAAPRGVPVVGAASRRTHRRRRCRGSSTC